MINKEYVTFCRNVSLSSYFKAFYFLVVQDLKKLIAVELFIRQFEIECFYKVAGEVGTDHLNSMKLIESLSLWR